MTKVIQEFSAADKKVPSVNNVMAIVMAGMTKVFVGEITAEGTTQLLGHRRVSNMCGCYWCHSN